MLLDFKRETTFMYSGIKWTAFKHGIGVRFDAETDVTVDVHSAIGQPNRFDPNRIYDYL